MRVKLLVLGQVGDLENTGNTSLSKIVKTLKIPSLRFS